jgi:hypothetical protein
VFASREIGELRHGNRFEQIFQTFLRLNRLLATSKSRRPFLHCHAENILLINLFVFGKDLCVHFLAKTILSDYGSLLEYQ